jgi:hypothetical protein
MEAPSNETGYSWLYWASGQHSGVRVFVTILMISLGAGVLVWYTRAGYDASPDSKIGLVYAILGTLLLLLAATLFSLRRRSRHRRTLGGLRASLGWHMCFALTGLAFLGMHSFGELNLRTGTYALYGMIALVISGLIGRFLDRLMPRLIAAEAHKALTLEGEDRLETISQKLQAIVGHNTQQIHAFTTSPNESNISPFPTSQERLPSRAQDWREQTLHTPWDLAYISLESTPQELGRESGQYRFVPDKKSGLMLPGALMPGTQEQMGELEEVQQAMSHELLYRYIIRYWRRFHILLALVTLGLVAWHIEFALQLMLPTMLH